MNGNRPHINLSASLSWTSNGMAMIDGSIDMKESQSDWTHFCDRFYVDLSHETEFPGCEMTALASQEDDTGGSLRARGGKNDHKWHDYGGKKLIKSARCRSDTKNDEYGQLGCKSVRFVPLHATYKHIEDSEPNVSKGIPNAVRMALFVKNLESPHQGVMEAMSIEARSPTTSIAWEATEEQRALENIEQRMLELQRQWKELSDEQKEAHRVPASAVYLLRYLGQPLPDPARIVQLPRASEGRMNERLERVEQATERLDRLVTPEFERSLGGSASGVLVPTPIR